MPLFISVGSNVQLGDLNQEWQDSLALAKKRPDLKVLEVDVNNWFAKNK